MDNDEHDGEDPTAPAGHEHGQPDRVRSAHKRTRDAHRRTRDAHQRAIGLHERAAAFYAAHGDGRRAQAEQAAAARERERLAEAERQVAADSPDA